MLKRPFCVSCWATSIARSRRCSGLRRRKGHSDRRGSARPGPGLSACSPWVWRRSCARAPSVTAIAGAPRLCAETAGRDCRPRPRAAQAGRDTLAAGGVAELPSPALFLGGRALWHRRARKRGASTVAADDQRSGEAARGRSRPEAVRTGGPPPCADEIFALGQDLMGMLKGRPSPRPLRLTVGVADALPKVLVQKLLQPAFEIDKAIHLVCREDRVVEDFMSQLAGQELDLVLADRPVGPGIRAHAFNHLLGECGTSFCASDKLAKRLRRGFPGSLDGAPCLLPSDHAT